MPGLGQQKPYLEALTTPYSPREGQKPVLYLSREPRVDPVLLTTLFPQPPRWGLRNRPINVNHYANKKSAAESMLDIALLMANASQLKAVVEQGNEFAFFVPLVVLISISLVLQIGVGVLLIFLGRTHGCLHGPGMGREMRGGGGSGGSTSDTWPSGSQVMVQAVAPHI